MRRSSYKRQAITQTLRAQPELSDRRVAAMVGVDHKTVATVRRELIATGEIQAPDSTIGLDGRARSYKSMPSTTLDPFVEMEAHRRWAAKFIRGEV